MFRPPGTRRAAPGLRRLLALAVTALCLAPLVLLGGVPLSHNSAAATRPKADQIGVAGNAFPWEPHWKEFQGLLDESAAGWARVELRFDYIHPTPSTWQWNMLDQLVDGYSARGIQQLGLLDYSVGWASGQGGSQVVFGPPTNMTAWEDYVRATVARYHDRIHAWEIWNEPDVAFFWNGQDGGDPVVYLELLQRAHRAIKSVDPDATVMNGGLTGTERGYTFMQRLLDLGGGAYLDAVAFHGYTGNDALDNSWWVDTIWPGISQVRERAGKPLWITEYGWSSGCGGGAVACSEDVQASRVARHTALLFKLGGVERVLLFLFKDPGDQPNYYGLTRANATKKPAFTAFATIANRLAGTRFERQVNLGSGIYDMRFSSSGRMVDVVWAQSGEQDVFFPTGTATVRTWDISGRQHDLTPSAGGVWLHLTHSPLLIEHDGQAPAGGTDRCRHFPETGQSLCDGFLDFWERKGGLMRFGYPISPELQEDGRTVQYLERMKFEEHPEAFGTDWAVMGELMGRTISAGREQETPFRALPNVSADPGCHAFAETGHTLCGGFRGYWEANGGLWMFGYPISEEFQERNEDTGIVYTVQYFERARFEWHPENAGTPYEVLLGRLGARLYEARYQ